MIGKQSFVNGISKKIKSNNQEVKVENIVEYFLEELENFIVNGEKITFQGLFSINLVERASRRGKNPKTGEEIIIPKRNSLSFKVSSRLKEKINKQVG